MKIRSFHITIATLLFLLSSCQSSSQTDDEEKNHEKDASKGARPQVVLIYDKHKG